MTADDDSLAARAATGDRAAFELLVRRHAAAVWRVAVALLRDDAAAERAVRDTFRTAHAALGASRGDVAVRTWLVAICVRDCVDRPPAATGDPLAEALRRLDADARAAFVLVDVLGHGRRDAAALLDTDPATLRARLAHARERLAVALAPAGAQT